MSSASAAGWRERVRSALPRGGTLPCDVWERRHRFILAVAWVHVPVIIVIGTVQEDVWHGVSEAALVATLTAFAAMPRFPHVVRASLCTLSLMTSTAILIHLFNGLIEMHFHFFVMVAVMALYQDWRPYLVGLGYVSIHHAVMGTLSPESVYNHPAAIAHPVWFSLLHAGFVLAESAACLMFWRVTEDALDAERAQRLEVEKANEALSSANERISDLVGMISHDLRTPATVINGYSAEALEMWDSMDDATRRMFLDRIGAAGRSLTEMLEASLTVTALDGEGLTAHPSPIRVDEAVERLLETLADPLPGAELSLEKVTAVVDRAHFTQVMTNLVTNAQKYGEPPYLVRASAEGDQVAIRVCDTGSGVPHDFVPELFDRYARAAGTSTTSAGTGLGLYIVRELVEANGGTIDYETAPGFGAVFVVRLPRAADQTVPAARSAIAV